MPIMLAYTDDLVVIAGNEVDWTDFLNNIESNLSERVLAITYNKSNIMICSTKRRLGKMTYIKIGNRKLAMTNKIKYLGTCIISALSRTETVRERIKTTHRVTQASEILLIMIYGVKRPTTTKAR